MLPDEAALAFTRLPALYASFG